MNPEPEGQAALRARCRHPSGRYADFAAEEIEQSIPARFSRQAALHAARPAVVGSGGTLSYRELATLSRRIAGAVSRRLGGANEPVALLLEHDPPSIAALLGVLEAGACYVPLDAAAPRSRAAHILADSGARLVLTAGRWAPMAAELAGGRVPVLDMDALDEPIDPALDMDIAPSARASMYYTSGTTGPSKGVPETHRNRLARARRNTQALGVCADDRLTLLFSTGVSASVNTMFAALLNGACLCLLDLREAGFSGLARWLREQAITIYHSTPAVFRGLTAMLREGDALPRVRAVLLTSDAVYRADVAAYQRCFADSCVLLNAWATTESPFFRPFVVDKTMPLDGLAVPAIGPPVDEDEVRVVDAEGRPVAPGVAGEIVLTSRYLSPGYHGQAELTRTRFRDTGGDPDVRTYLTHDVGRMAPDGTVTILGRTDFQVKVRGHRVEPGEVEMALRGLDGVRDAAVIGRPDGAGDHQLVAYVVAQDPAPTADRLRQSLRLTLPEYLVPARLVLLPALPVTASGKLDRSALPDPGRARPPMAAAFLAPRTPLEGTLEAIWADVLGLDRVGMLDDFLELGGDSLRAMTIATRVRDACGVEISVATLLATPTVSAMAVAVLEGAGRLPAAQPMDADRRG